MPRFSKNYSRALYREPAQPCLKQDGKILPASWSWGHPEPLKPWSVRRTQWADRIAQAGEFGMRVNSRGFYKTNTREASSKDLDRMIQEGYAVLSLVQLGVVRRGGVRVLRLTPKGWALTSQTPPLGLKTTGV